MAVQGRAVELRIGRTEDHTVVAIVGESWRDHNKQTLAWGYMAHEHELCAFEQIGAALRLTTEADNPVYTPVLRRILGESSKLEAGRAIEMVHSDQPCDECAALRAKYRGQFIKLVERQ